MTTFSIHSAAATIEASISLEQVWEAFLAALRPAHLKLAIYITVDANFETPLVLTNAADIYSGIPPSQDPFLKWCCNSYVPTQTGAAYLEDYGYLPEEAKSFIRRAGDLGFQSGLGLPVRLQGSDRFGGFNLGTALPRDQFEAKVVPLTEQLQFLCLVTHRRIEELSRKLDPNTQDDSFRAMLIAPQTKVTDQLSPREREIIYLIARGLSRKECARLCQISPHTVAEYTKNAYRKLGVRNRFEAADALRSI
jgi:DNA-binding CsgD family transcriptional regulator